MFFVRYQLPKGAGAERINISDPVYFGGFIHHISINNNLTTFNTNFRAAFTKGLKLDST